MKGGTERGKIGRRPNPSPLGGGARRRRTTDGHDTHRRCRPGPDSGPRADPKKFACGPWAPDLRSPDRGPGQDAPFRGSNGRRVGAIGPLGRLRAPDRGSGAGRSIPWRRRGMDNGVGHRNGSGPQTQGHRDNLRRKSWASRRPSPCPFGGAPKVKGKVFAIANISLIPGRRPSASLGTGSAPYRETGRRTARNVTALDRVFVAKALPGVRMAKHRPLFDGRIRPVAAFSALPSGDLRRTSPR